MARPFAPESIIEILDRHRVLYVLIGGLAAIARQSPYMTGDTNICPEGSEPNLARLAEALRELRARRITDIDPDGIEVNITPGYLSAENELSFMTLHGQLDLIFVPSGTKGYEDLKRDSTTERVFGYEVAIPSTLDVIRMKDARGLPKDRIVVDVLREILARGPEKPA